jgi:hypothetical protein
MAFPLEAAFIEQLRRQEAGAFTFIYEQHKVQIHNYLYRLSGSRELPDDLTHDTFLSAYESLPKLRLDSSTAPHGISTLTCSSPSGGSLKSAYRPAPHVQRSFSRCGAWI